MNLKLFRKKDKLEVVDGYGTVSFKFEVICIFLIFWNKKLVNV